MKIAVTYVGKDRRYFETFKQDIGNEYGMYTLAFRSYQIDEEHSFVDVFESILAEKPNILYLDFSTDVKSMTKLLELLVAYQNESMALIALYPQLDHEKNREELMCVNLEIGIHANIVKSGDDFIEPIFIGMRLGRADLLKKSEFFELKAKNGEIGKIIDVGKINYISKEEIECETNLALQVGDEVTIEHNLPIDIVESNVFVCKSCDNKGLYYSRNFKQNFYPIFKDYIFEKEDLSKLERAKLEDEKERRIHLIETQNKPAFADWVDEHINESKSKVVKLAVIDHNLCPIKKEHLIDPEINFSCKVWASSDKCTRSLYLYYPDIVVFQMETIVERNDVNSEAALERLIKFFQANQYGPYVIVFGAKFSTDELKNIYDYPNIMAYPDDIFINAISAMVKSFDAKKNQEISQTGVPRFVPGKQEQVSSFLIEHEIKILRISEYDIDFELSRDLVDGSFFRMKFPADMIMRIVPQLEKSPFYKQKGIYHGVFHSITNEEKKRLRQYIQQKKD